MKMLTLILLSAMAIALPSCAAPPRASSDVILQQLEPLPGVRGKKDPKDRFTTGRCDHDKCFFLVTVKACDDVKIDPNIMTVKKRRQTLLTWDLDAPAGFTFDTPAAVPFKPSTPPPAGEFGPEKVAPDGLTVSRVNYNKEGGTFDYQVRIAKNGTFCGGIDPPIINEY